MTIFPVKICQSHRDKFFDFTIKDILLEIKHSYRITLEREEKLEIPLIFDMPEIIRLREKYTDMSECLWDCLEKTDPTCRIILQTKYIKQWKYFDLIDIIKETSLGTSTVIIYRKKTCIYKK